MEKVILITGASSGIGKETALTLIKQGHVVYGAARRIEAMKSLEDAGGHALRMDVTKPDEVKAAVRRIIEEEGKIDVLVNNAGYGLYGAVEDIPLDDARRQFEVNLFGLASVTQEVLPHMREKKSGTIINISSVGGKIYTPLGAWYHGTKHAVEGWSDCLRLELKDFGIDVVIVEPGGIETEFGNVLYEPMLRYSGNGAYSALATKAARATKDLYNRPGALSPSSVVADAVSRAVHAGSPKTRYRIGKYAKSLAWIRLRLGDRIFDRVILSQLK